MIYKIILFILYRINLTNICWPIAIIIKKIDSSIIDHKHIKINLIHHLILLIESITSHTIISLKNNYFVVKMIKLISSIRIKKMKRKNWILSLYKN